MSLQNETAEDQKACVAASDGRRIKSLCTHE